LTEHTRQHAAEEALANLEAYGLDILTYGRTSQPSPATHTHFLEASGANTVTNSPTRVRRETQDLSEDITADITDSPARVIHVGGQEDDTSLPVHEDDIPLLQLDNNW
jgi:hypothetical protein